MPSNLLAIDKVVTAAEKNTTNSVTERLYGKSDCSIHVAFYNGLLVGVMPYRTPHEFLEEMPARGHYFDAIRTAPDKDPCDNNYKNWRDQKEDETETESE